MEQAISPRIAILTVSDRAARGESADQSGPALAVLLQARLGISPVMQHLVADEQDQIAAMLREWADSAAYDVILTTGGTGLAARDVTPEATAAVITRAAPGLAEAMRAASLAITPHAMLSRGVAGVRGRTLIVNLPGSPKAACEMLEVIVSVLPHAVELLRQDALAVRYQHARAGEHGQAG
ncbi:MAG: MogA/MoaB family molybdenum cofactor biosynthesis protein [Caldilineales bacterium]